MLPPDKSHLEAILERAGDSPGLSSPLIFKPSHVYRVLRDTFGLWCDYHAPKEEAVHERSRFDELMRKLALQHKDEWIASRFSDIHQIAKQKLRFALKDTIQAMVLGEPVIAGWVLWATELELGGQGDLLVRDDSHPSDLGPYHYRVLEVRRAKNPKKTYSLQGALLTRVLSHIQGYTPKKFQVALMDFTKDYNPKRYSEELDEIMQKWREVRSGHINPSPNVLDGTGAPWRVYGNKWLEERGDLTLLPEVHPTLRDKIVEELGVESVTDLGELSQAQLTEALGSKMGRAVFYSAKAYLSKAPVFPKGEKFTVPQRKRNIYFDFENSDDMYAKDMGHVYLVGIWDAERKEFKSFQGTGSKDEERVFKEFAEYVGPPEEAQLFHWGDFEPRHMKKLMDRFPALRSQLEGLLHSSIDLMSYLRPRVYLPVTTYSLKNVAPALGFNWRVSNMDGFESMVVYWDYLETGNRDLLDDVIKYNEDDCKAMWHVVENLTHQYNQSHGN